MEKVYNIKGVKIFNDCLILIIDNKEYIFPLDKVSDKLFKASETEKNDFKISPSGYGIHWRLIDEDISINGLFRLMKR